MHRSTTSYNETENPDAVYKYTGTGLVEVVS